MAAPPANLAARLKAFKSNINLNKTDQMPKVEQLSLGSKFHVEEEYKTLRKPKPATLLRIQKSNQIKSNEVKPQSHLLSKGPIRQEEKKTKNDNDISRKYDVRKQHKSVLNEDLSSQDSEEIEPEVFDLNYNKKESMKQPQNFNNIKLLSNLSLNYNEYHLANILHTKIMAHTNGFFANNIPDWYKNTFDKILPKNWLEILEKSNKFSLENVNNKIVLYALEDSSKIKIDAVSSEDTAIETTKFNEQVKELQNTANRSDSSESPRGFVRYKHLEKSMKQYKNTAGRDVSYTSNEKPPIKTNDKFTNSKYSKTNVRYKHLQGPWSK